MGAFSDYQVNSWLSSYNQSWVSLHFNDPQLSAIDSFELYGGDYVRQLGSFNISSARTTWLGTPLTWSGLPASEILYIGGWDDENSGNLLWSCAAPLDVNGRVVSVAGGGSYTLPASAVSLSIL